MKYEFPYGPIIWGVLVLALVGCVSCTMGGKKENPSSLVDDMAENCKNGMSMAEVDHDNGLPDKVKVVCAEAVK